MKISSIFEIALIGLYLYGVFFHFHYFLFFVGILAILFYRFILYLDIKNCWDLKDYHKSMILIGLILSLTGGNIFRLYTYIPQLDKTHHLLFPLGMVFILNHVYKKYDLSIGFGVVSIFCTIMTLCLMFEFVEFAMDRLLSGSTMQGVFLFNGEIIMTPIEDTMIDLFLGMIGSVIGLIAVRWNR